MNNFPVSVLRWLRCKIRQRTSAIYYVSADGNDSNSGTDPLDAFASLGKAFASVGVGGSIIVGAGTYTETGLDLSTAGVTVDFEPEAGTGHGSTTGL